MRTVTRYVAGDGKEFESQEECRVHELVGIELDSVDTYHTECGAAKLSAARFRNAYQEYLEWKFRRDLEAAA